MFTTPIHHVAFVTRDLEKALSFWRDTLGWKVIMDEELAGPEIENLIGLSGVKARTVMLQQADKVFTGMIEIIEFSSPPGKPFPADEKFNDIGLRLLSFNVADIDAAYEELKKKGCRFHSPPQRLNLAGFPTKAAIFREPVDGFQVEIVQYLGMPERLKKKEQG
jgi:catechol 2,3-dioxygenase-like lactoylglutathione lyase family enzyme